MVKLDAIWEEVEALGNSKAGETKRATLLLGIKEAFSHVFVKPATQQGMTYDELKWTVIASSAFLTSDMKCRD